MRFPHRYLATYMQSRLPDSCSLAKLEASVTYSPGVTAIRAGSHSFLLEVGRHHDRSHPIPGLRRLPALPAEEDRITSPEPLNVQVPQDHRPRERREAFL